MHRILSYRIKVIKMKKELVVFLDLHFTKFQWVCGGFVYLPYDFMHSFSINLVFTSFLSSSFAKTHLIVF